MLRNTFAPLIIQKGPKEIISKNFSMETVKYLDSSWNILLRLFMCIDEYICICRVYNSKNKTANRGRAEAFIKIC